MVKTWLGVSWWNLWVLEWCWIGFEWFLEWLLVLKMRMLQYPLRPWWDPYLARIKNSGTGKENTGENDEQALWLTFLAEANQVKLMDIEILWWSQMQPVRWWMMIVDTLWLWQGTESDDKEQWMFLEFRTQSFENCDSFESQMMISDLIRKDCAANSQMMWKFWWGYGEALRC